MRDWARRVAVALALLCVPPAGCASAPPPRVVFSEALLERYRLAEAELRGLQYYVSHQVVLERKAAGGTRHVDAGRLVVRGGTTLHQVVIPAGTPGRVEHGAFVGPGQGSDAIEVSFEKGAPLRFAPHEPGGAYLLEPPKRQGGTGSWTGAFLGSGRPSRFEVSFAGEPWEVVAGVNAHLMIETDALESLTEKQRVLRGVVGRDTR